MDAVLSNIQCIVTCEHAVNTIPERYQHLFHQEPNVLNTHQAIDFGALSIAKHFSRVLNCPLFEANASRLLIECNRSLHHRALFSEWTKGLSDAEKESLITEYYQPFRDAVESDIQSKVKQGIQVLHLSIHSFTPVFHDITRNTDIGFLYDPTRYGEKSLATQWRRQLSKERAPFHVRMNYPYRGTTDGFASALRKQYTEKEYLGFEIESNQALTQNAATLESLSHHLTMSFSHLLNR